MNEKCQKWHEQIKTLRDKHAEFMKTYAEALKFAEENPKMRETSFVRCRELFHEIKPLVMELREDFPLLTKEQLAELKLLKTNFDALPQLHEGIKWEDVEKSLMASPDAINKLRALDEKGHKMNVFGEESGDFIFASGWENYQEVSADHRSITYDLEGQKIAEKNGRKPIGNAVDIATAIGVDLANTKIHKKLLKTINVSGWAWLNTYAITRISGNAKVGTNNGIFVDGAARYGINCSFRAALRVKKA